MNFLENLKENTEEEKMAIAAMIAGAVALILFLIWGITFFHTVASGSKEGANKTAELKQQQAEVITSVSDIVNQFSGDYKDLKATLDRLQQTGTTSILGDTQVEVSVDKKGDVQVKNVMVGPIKPK